MIILVSLIIGIVITSIIVIETSPKETPKQKEQEPILESTGSTQENEPQPDDFYRNAEFVNKHCTSLKDFIINDDFNEYDLRKLADLNKIDLQINEGWYPITIELIRDLDKLGWNKEVSCIKEKYARLEFYTKAKFESDIYNLIEDYGEKSESICETCGEPGTIITNHGAWMYVACEKHYTINRGTIIVEQDGFKFNGNFHAWDEFKNASLEESQYYKGQLILTLEYKVPKQVSPGRTDNSLMVFSHSIGFDNLIDHAQNRFKNLLPN